MLLPCELYDYCGMGPGRTVGILCGGFRVCQVAGYYEGAVEGGALRSARRGRPFLTDDITPSSASRNLPISRFWALSEEYIRDAPQARMTVRSFDDLAEFQEKSGGGFTITYHSGWDADLFSRAPG